MHIDRTDVIQFVLNHANQGANYQQALQAAYERKREDNNLHYYQLM